jgi:hypothetical protein
MVYHNIHEPLCGWSVTIFMNHFVMVCHSTHEPLCDGVPIFMNHFVASFVHSCSFLEQMKQWQPCHLHLTRLLQSASFLTSTLSDELCLGTNNRATSLELLTRKNVPNSFFGASIGHQPSRSKHLQQSASGHIPTLGKCCQQHYQAHSACNATTGQHLVFNWSAHYSGSLSLHCYQRTRPQRSDRLRCPRAPSTRSTSHGLTLPSRNQPMAALLTSAHSQRQTGHSLPVLWCKRVTSWPHELQLYLISVWPFSGSHIFTKASPH